MTSPRPIQGGTSYLIPHRMGHVKGTDGGCRPYRRGARPRAGAETLALGAALDAPPEDALER